MGRSDRSLTDFVARAKAAPDTLRYASAVAGTTTCLGAALFLQQAGLQLMHVPDKGNGAALPDVIAGQGVPGHSRYLWLGLMASAGTPEEVWARLSQALHCAIGSKKMHERMREGRAQPMPMSPDDCNEFPRCETGQTQKLVSVPGIEKQ